MGIKYKLRVVVGHGMGSWPEKSIIHRGGQVGRQLDKTVHGPSSMTGAALGGCASTAPVPAAAAAAAPEVASSNAAAASAASTSSAEGGASASPGGGGNASSLASLPSLTAYCRASTSSGVAPRSSMNLTHGVNQSAVSWGKEGGKEDVRQRAGELK